MDEQEVIHEEERSQGRGRPRSHMTQLGLPSQRLTKVSSQGNSHLIFGIGPWFFGSEKITSF
ncbi:hypothetical protein DPMN_092697 [Dreissena polymorpha]|uniref:Uncharacterized protein n=1 Tax=Dreissena polymorpha TaxID=45954 RepID=A0A9D4R0F1_DREPO|nr:hypothetical protein DPMN_092697 [Dreissena polymorpha]